MRRMFLFSLPALLAAMALVFAGGAFAEDEAPQSPAPTAAAEKPECDSSSDCDKSECSECTECNGCDMAKASPVMAMMSWIGKQIVGDGPMCPTTEAGEKAWRNWYAGGADVPLAAMRDHLVANGWTADKTVAWFKAAAAAQQAAAKPAITTQPAADVATEGATEAGGCCGKCDTAGPDCGGCDKAAGDCDKEAGGCQGCPGKKDVPAESNP